MINLTIIFLKTNGPIELLLDILPFNIKDVNQFILELLPYSYGFFSTIRIRN